MKRPPEGSWSRHYQDAWHDDAINPVFPLAQRVGFLAFATHRANGHARFKTGEVAKVLGAGRFDEAGKPMVADRRTVHRAIKQAIEIGFLAEQSTSLCLIVPGHRISGGVGDEDESCDRHRPPQRRPRRAQSRPERLLTVVSREVS